jgi:hypothetical protein
MALPQVPYWIFVAFDMSPRRLMWFVGAPAGWKTSVRLGGSLSLTRRAALAGGGLAMLTGLPAAIPDHHGSEKRVTKLILLKDDVAGRRQAFHNVVSALTPAKFFPENVFSGIWSAFLFFESDRMLAEGFAEIIGDFPRADNSSLCCLLNLSETRSLEFENASAIYLDAMVTGSEYRARLRGDGPATGWLYSMDKYGCASDKGEWEIYCEKDSDVAVIGLRNANGAKKFGGAIQKLRAAAIETLGDGELAGLFPFSQLSPEWRRGLTLHYGKKATPQAFS